MNIDAPIGLVPALFCWTILLEACGSRGVLLFVGFPTLLHWKAIGVIGFSTISSLAVWLFALALYAAGRLLIHFATTNFGDDRS